MQQVNEVPEHLPTFQANVNEGMPRVFYYDPMHKKALYTYVDDVDARGGFESQTIVMITAQSTDEFSVRCWELTAGHRKRLDDQAVSQRDGQPEADDTVPVEGPGIQSDAETVSESSPMLPPEEREQFADVRQIPTHFTPPDAEPEPSQESPAGEDVVAAILITAQRDAIEDLSDYVELYVEDDKIKQLAENKRRRIEGLYERYGLEEVNRDDDRGSA